MAANKPFIVGSFVLGGLLLAVAAILLFGGTRFFSSTVHVVVVFKDSVAGLDVGSPVTFRGVSIGKVERMKVQVNATNQTGLIPVYLELDPDKISWTDGRPRSGGLELREAVKAGLRAQLNSQSLITGLLNVNLEFHPGAPDVPTHATGSLFEIPTIPSDMQNFEDELRGVKLRELADDSRKTLASTQRVLAEVQGRIGPLADGLQTTLETTNASVHAVQVDANRALDHIDQLAIESRRQVATNGQDLDRVLQSAERTATQLEKLANSLNDMISPNSPMRGDLQASLRDLAASASSLRTFTRNLERNPAGTLFARKPK
jgi:paraquat-inducible protein B